MLQKRVMKNQNVGSFAVVDSENSERLPKLAYDERIENGKIVLQGRGVKLVQIMDTPEDRKQYCNVMHEYLQFVKREYVQDADINNIDLNACFEEECIIRDKRKLPLFFAYRNDGKLLGTIGSTHLLLPKSAAGVVLNEYSCRFVFVAKCGHSIGKSGYEALRLFPMFALSRSVCLFFTSFQKLWLRDLWMHYAKTHNFRFIGTKIVNLIFLNRSVKNDVFAMSVIPSSLYQEILSFGTEGQDTRM